jgi:hypothetical protein
MGLPGAERLTSKSKVRAGLEEVAPDADTRRAVGRDDDVGRERHEGTSEVGVGPSLRLTNL